MRATSLLISLLFPASALLAAGTPSFQAPSGVISNAYQNRAMPPASSTAKDLLWIADTRKMDTFLSQVNPLSTREDGYHGEALPDTRAAWREYAREAYYYADHGEEARVVDRLNQMLKLAALYRQYGGMHNIVQAEEIRYLAGRTAQQLGYGGRLNSPYLEERVEDCLSLIEREAGGAKASARPIFWQHLMDVASQSFSRLSGHPIRSASLAVAGSYSH